MKWLCWSRGRLGSDMLFVTILLAAYSLRAALSGMFVVGTAAVIIVVLRYERDIIVIRRTRRLLFIKSDAGGFIIHYSCKPLGKHVYSTK